MATGLQMAWSKTAANNGDADTAINYAEGQAPSTLNDSARALMAAVRKFYEDIRGGLETGGTATAYTLTTNESWSALADGLMVSARMHAASGASPTLNVDSRGAKGIVLAPGVVPPAGTLREGGVYTFTYDATEEKFVVQGAASLALKDIGDVFDTAATVAPAGSVFCYGQALNRTTYAALFTAIGTTWGAGDGSTTFNVPDFRGRVRAGRDDMGGSSANRLTNQSGGLNGDTLGATGGAETHTLASAESGQKAISAAPVAITDPGHNHVERYGSAGSGGNAAIQGTTSDTNAANAVQTTANATTGITAAFTLAGSAAASAHNNVQPTAIVNTCIYTGVF